MEAKILSEGYENDPRKNIHNIYVKEMIINPFACVQPVNYTMEAFVAPANFDPDAQELNIVKAFAAYPNVNKKYIFSVGTSTTTVLLAVAGRSYAYSENGGAYTTIPSGTVTWTVGSTKRNVVVIDSASSVIAAVPIGGGWVYASDKVYSFYSNGNTLLKYINCQTSTSVTSIGNNSFKDCSGLIDNLTIPNSVTSIGSAAFQNCSALISVTIPNSVTSIGDAAFINCSNAVFNNDNLNLNNLSGVLSRTFASCRKLKKVDLNGSSITIIDGQVFDSCSALILVTIPNSVTSIGYAAFRSCSALISVINYRSIPQQLYDANVFSGVNKAIPLHVPVGSLAAYQAAPYWNEFTNIIDDL